MAGLVLCSGDRCRGVFDDQPLLLSMYYRFLFILLFSGTIAAQAKPEPEIARSSYAEKIYRESVAGQKVKLYKRWLKKFPPRDFPNSLALYDFARIEIAKAYILQKNSKKALAFADGIVVDEIKPEIWFSLGNAFFDKDYMEEAERFLLMAWDKAYQYVIANKSDPASLAVVSRFPEYSIRISDLLYNRRKEKEALGYIKIAFDRSGGQIDVLNNKYLSLLVAYGYDSLAAEIGENLIMSGVFDYELRSILFSLTLKNKAMDSVLAQAQNLNTIAFNQRKSILAKEIIDIPAPEFTLSDLTGKKVSLSDYRGKVVVLDFWATWCIPCIESFPYLQRLVRSYQEDSLVKFLFIHTWEKDNKATQKAKKFMDENRYNFHVVMDLKDPVTEVNQVVENYNIEALPAKVIIDRFGKIRLLKLSGWKKETSDGNAMEELMAMIELARGEK